MKAIVQREYGSPDALRVAEIDRPRAGAGEVLLRVHAAGLDAGVWHLMTGRPYLVRLMGYGLRKPKHQTPGQDAAGTVAAVGAGVTRFQPGDEVVWRLPRRLRRVRLRARNGARSEAGQPHLRTGGHRSDVGPHRSPGAPRRGSGTAWPAGVDHRRGRRGGDVRGTARPGVRGGRHGRLQRGEDGSGARDRRPRRRSTMPGRISLTAGGATTSFSILRAIVRWDTSGAPSARRAPS